MNIIESVKQGMEEMTRTERTVASYFTEHPTDFAFYSLDKVARAVGTSTTTIIRFCRTAGFSGYKDLQIHLQEELRYQSSLPGRFQQSASESSDDSLVSRIVNQSIYNINATFSSLSEDLLNETVDLLEHGKRIFVFGMRESLALVHYTYTRLLTVRSHVQILDAGYNGIIESTLDLSNQDVCIFFLFHRYTDQSLYILPLLKEQGVRTILITSAPYDTVERYADILIPCRVKTQGIKNSSVAPLCLADYFCNALAMRDSDSVLPRLQKIEALLQHNKTLGS